MSSKLTSERVVISAPMSFHGSAARVWKITGNDNPYLRWLVIAPIAVIIISMIWFVVIFWYMVFGLLLVPYRLIRRGSRKNKREQLRHRELLQGLERRNQ